MGQHLVLALATVGGMRSLFTYGLGATLPSSPIFLTVLNAGSIFS